MANKTSRRNFLMTAPAAAAVGLTLADSLHAAAQMTGAPGADLVAKAAPFKVFKAAELEADAKKLQSAPGNINLVDQSAQLPCAVVMTTEAHHSATEFEWH